jgi:hypothetical protein
VKLPPAWELVEELRELEEGRHSESLSAETEESPLLKAVTRERLVKAEYAGKAWRVLW